MTRLVVGPFNRVEGDLEVTLDVDDGVVRQARVTTPLYRGFEQLLVGRPAPDALAIAPRICGICSVSQSIAAATLLRHLDGVAPARNGVLAANLAHAVENIADHLTHFYLFFMPDFARDEYLARTWFEETRRRFKAMSGEAVGEILPARARLLEIMGIVAGKWPHSLAFQPGGVTRGVDLGEKMRIVAILREFRDVVETRLFGGSIDRFLSIDTPAALDDHVFGAGATGDFSAFVRIARDLGLDRLGRADLDLMSFGAYHGDERAAFIAGVFRAAGSTIALPASHIAEHVAHSWFRESDEDPRASETIPDVEKPGAYSWAKAPRLSGRPVEVGAIARQAVDGDPLICALLAEAGGSNVFARVVARIREIARVLRLADDWARALTPKEPFCAAAPHAMDGQGVALVEAARGSLGHWATVRDGMIQRYQIIAPTTWNFSPRDNSGVPGPLETAFAGRRGRPARIARGIRSACRALVRSLHGVHRTLTRAAKARFRKVKSSLPSGALIFARARVREIGEASIPS